MILFKYLRSVDIYLRLVERFILNRKGTKERKKRKDVEREKVCATIIASKDVSCGD